MNFINKRTTKIYKKRIDELVQGVRDMGAPKERSEGFWNTDISAVVRQVVEYDIWDCGLLLERMSTIRKP